MATSMGVFRWLFVSFFITIVIPYLSVFATDDSEDDAIFLAGNQQKLNVGAAKPRR